MADACASQLGSRSRLAIRTLVLLGLVHAGCVPVMVPAGEDEPPAQRCPAPVSPVQAMEICPDGSLDPFIQSVLELGHRHWDPQSRVGRANRYVDSYAGQALTAQLLVSVDESGGISAIDLAKSSGEEELDGLALAAFQHGESLAGPPACALREGVMRFKVDMCVEVVRPRRVRWQWLVPPPPTGSPKERTTALRWECKTTPGAIRRCERR
jgi:hypothetical protein